MDTNIGNVVSGSNVVAETVTTGKNSRVKMINFTEILVDHSNNIRMASAYAPEALKDLQADILLNGLTDPISVVELPEGTPGPFKYKLLKGHRRAGAIQLIRMGNPSVFEKVPAVVYASTISESDQALLICDHANVQGLNEFEMYLSVKRLMSAGHGRKAICARLGQKDGWVQTRMQIAVMPSVLEDAFKAKFDKTMTGHPDIRTSDIGALNTAWINGGVEGFMEAWSKVSKGEDIKKTPPMRSRRDIQTQIDLLKKNKDMIRALQWVLGAEMVLVDYDKEVDSAIKVG